MKKILISTLVSACTVFGAEKVILDTKLIYQNGEDMVTVPLPECTSEKVTIKLPKKEFHFQKDDILEVCINWQGDENNSVYMKYFDSPPAPGGIDGTAMNMLAKRKLPSGTGADNIYNKNWRYNCPAVRIRATEVKNKKTTAGWGGSGWCYRAELHSPVQEEPDNTKHEEKS